MCAWVSTLSVCIVPFFFFFFQAEDGIRDKLVTGVQTCALPISAPFRVGRGAAAHHRGAPRNGAAARRLRDGSGGARPVPRNGASRAILRRWRVTPRSAARVLPSWRGGGRRSGGAPAGTRGGGGAPRA